METKEFNVKKSIEEQSAFCKTNGYPHFAPYDGVCFNCHKNIYVEINYGDGYKSGIDTEKATKSLVTGCPHCHYSYCE